MPKRATVAVLAVFALMEVGWETRELADLTNCWHSVQVAAAVAIGLLVYWGRDGLPTATAWWFHGRFYGFRAPQAPLELRPPELQGQG